MILYVHFEPTVLQKKNHETRDPETLLHEARCIFSACFALLSGVSAGMIITLSNPREFLFLGKIRALLGNRCSGFKAL